MPEETKTVAETSANTQTEAQNTEVDTQSTSTVSKEIFDKTASELAKLKKMYKESKTEEERKKLEEQEKEERFQEIEKENKRLKMVSDLAKGGINEKDIDSIVDAIVEGDVSKITSALISTNKNATSELQKTIDQMQLDSTEKPEGSTETSKLTKADFKKMTLDERTELKRSNFELYKEIKN